MIRLWLLLLCILAASPASAALSERDLARAVARPAAGTRLPALSFSDTQGRTATLPAFADGRPLVLIFADYTCRNVCSPGLTLTAARLRETGLSPGEDYQLAVIGIDPKDTRADALHFAQAIANMPEVARATLFLRGDAGAISAATGALGYGFVYDAGTDQYAHDASIYVFDRDGALTALLPEIGLSAAPLKAALTAQGRAGSWITQVAHVCYGFAAAHGKFGRAIVIGLQVLSVVLLLGVGLLVLHRRRQVAR